MLRLCAGNEQQVGNIVPRPITGAPTDVPTECVDYALVAISRDKLKYVCIELNVLAIVKLLSSSNTSLNER